ncbi:flagellar motor switch protein FliN/FliY [Salinibacillus kushneri]|uniref:Flagellar motor switch protein FliN/FliY n=1 Tax=Salinibacillus kushneri TaxID=237682 RepID=A0A1I0E875_9BACI|nr:flagellar motor switch phosphatase FliY [Salinibacillus kushneri]SET41418.1 flagellar motor switch protein FliN/FliY [Salinibacillus kushneri]
MSNREEMLSQEEIDALLNGNQDDLMEENNHAAEASSNDNQLSPIEQDALGEIGNISFGTSATTLSTLLNQKVEITTPAVSVVKKDELSDEFPQPHVAVSVDYTDGFSGVNLFVIKVEDAAVIADLMLGGDGKSPETELNDIHLSAVQEAMNQMMGSAATSMSSVFDKRVDISPPKTNVLDIKGEEGTDYIPEENVFVKVSFRLKVGELIDSNIMQILPIDFAREFVDELLNSSQTEQEEEQSENTVQEENTLGHEHGVNTSPSAKTNGQNNQEAEKRVPDENKHFGSRHEQAVAQNVQTAAFSEFENTNLESHQQQNLDMLMDIPLKVSVELGRTKRTIKEILEMGSGSIVELDKLAGEPVDIHVNDKLIAKGEVVVIDENFGVRVTDILSQTERIQKIR